MRIKICGMRDKENIEQLVALQPDFIGFIFYEKSARYVANELDEELVKSIPKTVKKVGVFVNASPTYILNMVKKYDLQYAQLHGSELPDFCRSIRQKGVNIIKAFLIDEHFNFAMLNNYKPHCDFFLFDTPGTKPGGNGVPFNWEVLKRYTNDKPFFISGGIGLDNIEELFALKKEINIYGVDVNSKFEIEPALKDINKVKQVITLVREDAEK